MLPLHRRRQQDVDQVADPHGHRCAQTRATREERVGDPDRPLQRQRQEGGEEVAVQVGAGGRRRGGERLPVLFGAEERTGLQQSRLELGVPPDAVLDDVDQFGRAALVLGVLGLVAGLRMLVRMAFSWR